MKVGVVHNSLALSACNPHVKAIRIYTQYSLPLPLLLLLPLSCPNSLVCTAQMTRKKREHEWMNEMSYNERHTERR
jgi:hypothetical protein